VRERGHSRERAEFEARRLEEEEAGAHEAREELPHGEEFPESRGVAHAREVDGGQRRGDAGGWRRLAPAPGAGPETPWY
jgi:hypothetical protein